MIVTFAELTVILALACRLDRLAVTRLRPHVRHALWTLVAIRLLVPAGLPVAPAILPIRADAVGNVAALTGTPPTAWVAGVWALGLVVVFLRAAWYAHLLRNRLRRLDPAADDDVRRLAGCVRTAADRIGLKHVPDLRIDPAAFSPYVTGLWSPRLVLPSDWRDWNGATLEHALTHELIHIRRRDLLAAAVWTLIACVYWFHPLVHVARRRAHETREMCCDADASVRIGPGYRLSLLRVIAAASGERVPVTASPSTHAWHPAIERLHALERWSRPPGWRYRLGCAALVVAATLLVLPAHAVVVRTTPASTVESLLDPATRLERGMGSLHLRYALLADAAAQAQQGGTE